MNKIILSDNEIDLVILALRAYDEYVLADNLERSDDIAACDYLSDHLKQLRQFAKDTPSPLYELRET